MNGFSILFFIFGTCVLLVGLYMFKGHKLDLIAWRAPFKSLNKDGWINVGKWTMISSSIIFILAILGLLIA